MTAITPHMLAQRHDAGRPASTMARPETSFAGLLRDGRAGPQAGSGETFSFAELGMFGRHGPLDNVAEAGNDKPENSTAAALPPPQDLDDEDIHYRPYLLGSAPTCGLNHGENALHTALASAPNLSNATTLPDAGSADTPDLQVPVAACDVQDVKGKTAGGGPIVPDPADKGRSALLAGARPAATASPGTVSLVMNASGNAAKIVARGDTGTPDARMRLRRLVADTLAEFGLGLDSLHLDGSDEGPSFPSITGGKHGTRQR